MKECNCYLPKHGKQKHIKNEQISEKQTDVLGCSTIVLCVYMFECLVGNFFLLEDFESKLWTTLVFDHN